jgi:hypothetical protein
MHSFFLCTSKNINECNKLWGMNNEINGVIVSNIGIYMCVDDPLNLYSQNKPTNNILLSDKQLNIQNLNLNVQRKINQTHNISNSSLLNNTNYTYISNITDFISTTTKLSTTTNNPTTIASTTTKLSTTTTELPTAITELSTTTNNPTTIASTTTKLSTTTKALSNNENINLNYQFNQTSTKKNELQNLDVVQDNTIVIIVTSISTISILGLMFCCYRFFPITKKICKKCYKKCKDRTIEKKELPTVDNKIISKKRRITPSKINTNHVINMPPQVITPKRKVSLGFNTMSNNMTSPTKKWYRETFKNELSEVNNPSPPPPPRVKTPKLQVPTLEVDLNREGFLEKHVQNNKMINNRMDNLIKDMEDCKKNALTSLRDQKKSLNFKEVGHVQQRVNSIEKRNRNPDLRNVRLNSWTRNQEGTFRK